MLINFKFFFLLFNLSLLLLLLFLLNRIWSTDNWTSDKWSLNNRSRVQCACWSPCSLILLFATDSCSIINAIDFRKSDVFNGSKNYKKVAWPIIDIKSECINEKV